jgi:hypothetical protein
LKQLELFEKRLVGVLTRTRPRDLRTWRQKGLFDKPQRRRRARGAYLRETLASFLAPEQLPPTPTIKSRPRPARLLDRRNTID